MPRFLISTAACLWWTAVSCGTPSREPAEGAVGFASEQTRREAAPQAPSVHPWCGRSPAPESLLVTPASFGPARVGMSRESLIRACPTVRDTVSFDAEGIELRASALRFSGVEAGIAEWSERGTLEKIRVLAPTAVTERGIRVGSTVGDLRRALPNLRMGYDDAGVYAWSDRQDRLSYLLALRITALLRVPDDVATRPDLVPDSSRVRAILIIGAQ